MAKLVELVREALEQMPPETRFRPEDEEVIARHRETLLSWTPELVQAFYDTLFAHPPTKAVFREGERPDREKTLEGWWQRTVEGPLDETYFAWMAKVGLVHVVRGVKNPMTLSMLSFVADFVENKSFKAVLPEAEPLSEAFHRLNTSVGVVITYAYDSFRAQALYEITGIEGALMDRIGQQESQAILKRLIEEGE
ncbi:protoglobin domain-containing protein [Thermus sediminis]|uniref:protoglobin domain-containing protein n=1 Tax=Thermus sediminis TaxID=1761908 RepID=UPI000E3E3CFE|nr:protoglobin domain-containing protein [Thermus sediminis]